MAPQLLTGMVISSQNINETDRRIVLLTRERGRISAFAKGAVKPKNPLVAATQPFTFGEYFTYQNRDSYTVVSANISKHFDFVRMNLDKYYYASYMCELAAYYTRENLDAQDVLLLLFQTFRALEKDTIENKLIRYIYEWRMLLINGEAPNVFSCNICKKKELLGQMYFSCGRHGIICGTCAASCSRTGADASYTYKILTGTLHTLQFILSTPLKKLFTFSVSKEVLKELEEITEAYISLNRNYDFNSLHFLDITDM